MSDKAVPVVDPANNSGAAKLMRWFGAQVAVMEITPGEVPPSQFTISKEIGADGAVRINIHVKTSVDIDEVTLGG